MLVGLGLLVFAHDHGEYQGLTHDPALPGHLTPSFFPLCYSPLIPVVKWRKDVPYGMFLSQKYVVM